MKKTTLSSVFLRHYKNISFEEYLDAFDMHPFTDRAKGHLGTGIIFLLYGRLAIEFFTCEKLLLANTKIRIKLI